MNYTHKEELSLLSLLLPSLGDKSEL
jgi:hypothetical protein